MKRAFLGSLFALNFCFAATAGADSQARLINGKPVDPGTWKEVVRISAGGSGCTATIVGPRVIATAAHCANNGATASFTVNGTKYDAKIFRSSLYPSKDHDVAIGITSQDIVGVEPASVGGKAVTGLGIQLLGYGCTNPGGGGGNDGILRIGDTTITGFSGFDMVSRKAGGAALCFGDSGGPAMIVENGKHLLIGINSKGNIQDTNYNTRWDIPESDTFIKGVASSQGIEICGINKICGGTPPPQQAPTCTLSATPNLVTLGNSLVLSIVTQGQATGATIEGSTVSLPTGSKTIQPSAVGTFTATATVSGPGGSNNCSATYTVQNGTPPPQQAPTCTLAANPDTIKIGQSLELSIQTTGTVTSAVIEGTTVTFPLGKKIITPPSKGNFTAHGAVTGPGGATTCAASYTVEDGIGPDPLTPNFAVVAAYCGDNTIMDTPVSRVCLAVINKDTSIMDLKMTQVLLVTYRDTTKEIMPIVHRKTQPKMAGDIQVKEDLIMYANNSVNADKYLVLDTRTAVLTKAPPRDGEVPMSISGRTAKGNYFLVENMKPFLVGE